MYPFLYIIVRIATREGEASIRFHFLLSVFPELMLELGPGLKARVFSITCHITIVSPFSVFGALTDQNRQKSGAKFPDGSLIHLGIWLGDDFFLGVPQLFYPPG